MNVTYQNGWAVPAGWKMVPEEPTEEMLAATSWPGCAKTDYRHMLRAAPQPAEPVKRKRRYAQGTALGELGIIPMCDQVDDEPVAPQPAEPESCFCDRMYPDSNPDASCGDCPIRDYGAKAAESVKDDDEGDMLTVAYMGGYHEGKKAAQAEPVKVPSDDMQLDAVKSTAAIAWGWLWHVTTADDRVKTARDLLGQMLDKDLKRYGIQNAKDEGAQVNVQGIEAAMLRSEFGDAYPCAQLGASNG